jgi:hypothetical protein
MDSVERLVNGLADVGGTLVVAGDKKGPKEYNADVFRAKVQFLSLADQLDSPFELARTLPTGHYSRKNIAYLEAIAQGAACIYETDDDNAPLPFWKARDEWLGEVRVVPAKSDYEEDTRCWVNIYKYFTEALIWPRGLPLDEIHAPAPIAPMMPKGAPQLRAPVQQGLVDNSPDVDAIWRLVFDRPFCFEARPSVYLHAGNWCPFNSQSTWWWPVAYPLLYIPSSCSFRMCDIWRSFVAQRCIWELNAGVAFHPPEVVQERNPHDLMKDFKEELPGYEKNRGFVGVLEHLDLRKGEKEVGRNLRVCYRALVNAGFFPSKELDMVDSWLGSLPDLRSATITLETADVPRL